MLIALAPRNKAEERRAENRLLTHQPQNLVLFLIPV